MKKENKIGLLNFHYSDHNYGAVLQAAALQKFIIDLEPNAKVENINYIPIYRKNKPNRIKKTLGKLVRSIGLKKNFYEKPQIKNGNVFSEFREDYIKQSKCVYSDPDELNCISREYSDIVVGSDQVWRVNYTREHALAYFLNFANESVNRVSYAASFGTDNFNSKDKDLIRNVSDELEKFSHISVREHQGVNICDEVFDLKATHVLDPTLLIDEGFFYEMVKNSSLKINECSDVVYYKLDVDKQFEDSMDSICFDLSMNKVENIYYYESDEGYLYNTVYDWLCKIRNSKIVVTDSFHCVCFSIIFEKEFICCANESRGMSRILSLLSQLGLEDRICRKESEIARVVSESSPINYSDVKSRLSQYQKLSASFLSSALNKS
ncbi:polysaccharide pyruvyl transferase family protein [Vibrio lentus]|uniref:polysaccharide pyruvyl transferase family protein n=1 Tax=Vibrio lentus TaxID=136468 RepID=UPI000CBA0349|nr:polysaccharide pyruvyl transferase family protein [Vibrio lentus]PMI85239.1 hypothetical protein BCU36_00960 [Vibrio lentus]